MKFLIELNPQSHQIVRDELIEISNSATWYFAGCYENNSEYSGKIFKFKEEKNFLWNKYFNDCTAPTAVTAAASLSHTVISQRNLNETDKTTCKMQMPGWFIYHLDGQTFHW